MSSLAKLGIIAAMSLGLSIYDEPAPRYRPLTGPALPPAPPDPPTKRQKRRMRGKARAAALKARASQVEDE